MAYRSYQKWVAKNGQESNLPGFRMTNEQMFWVALHLKTCLKGRSPSFNANSWSQSGLREAFGCTKNLTFYAPEIFHWDWDV